MDRVQGSGISMMDEPASMEKPKEEKNINQRTLRAFAAATMTY